MLELMAQVGLAGMTLLLFGFFILGLFWCFVLLNSGIRWLCDKMSKRE